MLLQAACCRRAAHVVVEGDAASATPFESALEFRHAREGVQLAEQLPVVSKAKIHDDTPAIISRLCRPEPGLGKSHRCCSHAVRAWCENHSVCAPALHLTEPCHVINLHAQARAGSQAVSQLVSQAVSQLVRQSGSQAGRQVGRI